MNAVKYVLRITLVGSSPRVWREIAVPSNIKLTSLAHVIVLAMGWEESHLGMFKKWRHTVKVLEYVGCGKDEKHHNNR
jgi:hypothetical protein